MSVCLACLSRLTSRFETGSRPIQRGSRAPPICFQRAWIVLPLRHKSIGEDMDSAARLTGMLCWRLEKSEADRQTVVRERASMLLSACLDIIKTREKSPGDIYRRIFEEARSGLLKASSTDTILGSLLAFSSMLQNQQIVRQIPSRNTALC